MKTKLEDARRKMARAWGVASFFSILTFALCLLLGCGLGARAAETNSLVWHKGTDRVDANIRGEPLWPLLENIARQTGWHIFVEPGAKRSASAKFTDLPSGEALRMLLGNLNFAYVPRTNGPNFLYVFTTTMQNATQRVPVVTPAPPKHVPNELLVRVKPGTDMDALAKAIGAKVIGRNDKLGLYRLQFADGAATDAALGTLKNNSDVADASYNYYYDAPPSPQQLSSAPVGPLSLTLNPPGDSGKVVVGLIDMPVQSLGDALDKFMLKQMSVVGYDMPVNDPTHGTAMAYTILNAIAQQSAGGSSVQILPVNVYGSGEATTSWDVALGVQTAVNNGANVLNLSLSGTGDDSVLASVLQQAVASGILVYAAAGNQPVNTPTYPAADKGVISVTALQGQNQLAPYANDGSWVDLALPGGSIVYFNGQPWGVQGTSVSTAYATGVAAGNRAATGASWAQILAAMQQKFPVPKQ